MKRRAENVARDLVAAWNTPNGAERRERLKDACDADCRFMDPLSGVAIDGRAAMAEHIEAARAQAALRMEEGRLTPTPAGFQLAWRLRGVDGGDAVSGVWACETGADGRVVKLSPGG